MRAHVQARRNRRLGRQRRCLCQAQGTLLLPSPAPRCRPPHPPVSHPVARRRVAGAQGADGRHGDERHGTHYWLLAHLQGRPRRPLARPQGCGRQPLLVSLPALPWRTPCQPPCAALRCFCSRAVISRRCSAGQLGSLRCLRLTSLQLRCLPACLPDANLRCCPPPCPQQLEVGLPDVMMAGLEQYTQYFDELNSKTRRLSWQVGRRLRVRTSCAWWGGCIAASPWRIAWRCLYLLPRRGGATAACAAFSLCWGGHRARYALSMPHSPASSTPHPTPPPPPPPPTHPPTNPPSHPHPHTHTPPHCRSSRTARCTSRPRTTRATSSSSCRCRPRCCCPSTTVGLPVLFFPVVCGLRRAGRRPHRLRWVYLPARVVCVVGVGGGLESHAEGRHHQSCLCSLGSGRVCLARARNLPRLTSCGPRRPCRAELAPNLPM